ncbi:glycoside hydrolase family 16 protein [Sparassis latifolia]|uniref:Probable glycosidase n=1 Tax=Sparassis crispa TaxID=139825 RepID=A0A401G6Y3_9APHY|nr:Probable glycosidase [Sparassis crispa]GBE77909.1 Probable glycosidase [Sparassis crispa]
MYLTIPLTLIPLLAAAPVRGAFSGLPNNISLGSRAGLSWLSYLFATAYAASFERRANGSETDTNGTTFVWTVQDVYQGQTFFDRWNFYTGSDPTHGSVNYTDRETAYADGLYYVTEDNIVVMKGDNTTWLAEGGYRNSVRISSQAVYNTGLFILDLNMAPWGCGVWPAWWTVGNNWPLQGEIDILEGVHDNEHNQVTWHTGPNCNLTQSANYTGTIVETNGNPNLVCNCVNDYNSNAGCGVTEWSRASYGPIFDAQGGGVFAMKWDDQGIAIWSFYRAAIPQDVTDGLPDPSTWGVPVAFLAPSACDPITNFVDHSIIFDITFCGDWAGNSYSTAAGCTGTCAEHIMDPSNFVNASWHINSLTVYKKQTLNGQINNGARRRASFDVMPWLSLAAATFALGWAAV